MCNEVEESCEMGRVHKGKEVKGDVYAIKGTIIDRIKKRSIKIKDIIERK